MIANRHSAIILLIISSVGISFGGLIMRNIMIADPFQITFYRGIAFFSIISLILFFQYGTSMFSIIKKVGIGGLLASIFHTLANLFFIQAFANTSIANSLFTLSSIPFITAGLAFFFLNERLSLTTLLIMVVSFVGIFIMISEGLVTGGLYGNFMAICTAIFFSGFAIIIRKNKNIDMIPTMFISGCMITLISFFLSKGELNIPLNDIYLCFLWGGLLSGFVNYIFIFATRFLYASGVTFFMLLEFSLGPFWVWIFLNETVSQKTLFGGAIVMICVLIYSIIEIYNSRQILKRGRVNLS